MVFEDKDLGYEKVETGNSVSWTNNKGFYLLLDKIMAYIAVSRLENNLKDWVHGLDTLASFTRKFWSNEADLQTFEDGYMKVSKDLVSSGPGHTAQVKNIILQKNYNSIRELEKVVFNNISHLMLKSSTDMDDDADWLTGDDD